MTKKELAIIQKAFFYKKKTLKEIKLLFGWKLVKEETAKEYLDRITNYEEETNEWGKDV